MGECRTHSHEWVWCKETQRSLAVTLQQSSNTMAALTPFNAALEGHSVRHLTQTLQLVERDDHLYLVVKAHGEGCEDVGQRVSFDLFGQQASQ